MVMQTIEKSICSDENPMEYFQTMVNSAAEDLHVSADETVLFYIVNLLSEFVQSENVYAELDINADQEPLTILLEKALNSEQNEQISRFKHLGDFSLFISGFFSDSIYRRLILVSVHISQS